MILMIDNYDSFTYNIVQYCLELGADLKVIRNDELTVEEIEALNPEKIILSPGPATPDDAGICLDVIKYFANSKPIFGICLGSQLMAIASGASTYKLKYGHRSHNQPVQLVGTDKCYITSQNHGFAVDNNTLGEGWEPLFINVNDNTAEGIKHKSKPFFSTQFHPEASGGPVDTEFLFDDFIESIEKAKK